MKEKKGASLYTRLVSLLLCLAIAVTLIPRVPFTLASDNPDAEGVYHIRNFADLVGAVGYSRSDPGNKIKYVLENDIDIKPADMAGFKALTGGKINHISFGSKDYYFLGEFDGGGHTISGLNYDNVLLDPETRTGLFAFVGYSEYDRTFPTYIHDLTLKGASIHADYCAGILAGDAYNTRFENISIVDSSLSVNPADNALVLITDGGAYGGAVAGYAESCTFYNCESRNTTVRANSVAGVAALSGKPLYMGGLAGEVQNSVVEYCRVMGGAVKNRYETSVGALGGFTCYAGGLAGQAGGLRGGDMDKFPCKFIDCFASCDVSFHAATYVGVGAGCAGHAGGLLGKVKDNTFTTIKRCHYAGGTISSYQYNTLLLMIPVQIADDVNRSGLVDECANDRIQVYDSYFNYKDTIGPKNGKPANVLGNKTVTDQYGPQPDDRYEDRTFWENRGYDFAGNLDRSDEDGTKGPLREGDAYYNKWVMYYYKDKNTGEVRGYPVHGLSVAATFDFPNAATVTLAPTLDKDSLSREGVSTTDPYRFAVLGIYPTERHLTEYTDGTDTKGGVSLSIAMNAGYRLVNWYLEPDVAAAGLPDGQHAYFEKIFADESKKRADLVESNPHVPVEDNQLYVAQCEARVRFYDVNGGSIDVDGAGYPTEAAVDESDDWYFYHDVLPDVQPQTRPESTTATLIGWTTVPNVVGGVNKGYPAIDTVTLGNLRRDGNFYAPSSLVEKAMDLYPVYADLVSNVMTRYEGHEQDANEDKTLREGYGKTSVTMENNVATIHVTGADEGGNFPDGVRFLGWYEIALNGDGTEGTAHLVSRKQDFTLTDVDLTAKHLYEARFEYRVQFWLPEKAGNTAVNGKVQYTDLLQDVYVKYGTQLFTSEWESAYLANFGYNDTADNSVNVYTFSHWTDTDVKHDSEGNVLVYHGTMLQTDLEKLAETAPKYVISSQVGAPLELYGIFSKAADYFNYSNYVTTDFPGSATVNIDVNDKDHKKVSAAVNPGYNYIFWDMYGRTGNEGDGFWGGKWSSAGVTYTQDPQKAIWDTDRDIFYGRGYTLYYTAHMTADVNFHQAVNKDTLMETPVTLSTTDFPYLTADKTVSMTRRYRSPVFGGTNNVYNSYLEENKAVHTFNGDTANGGFSPAAERCAAPTRAAMTIPGYYFVGWLEPAAWEQTDLDYFLDVTAGEGEPFYQSSSVGLCQPYVLPDDAVVEHTMELYPVYVKYHIDSTTNVMLEVAGAVNKPGDPTWTPEKPTTDSADLTITAQNNVPVRTGEPEGEKYTIEYITVTIDGGEPVKLPNPTDTTGDWVLHYTVVPGKHYLFTAVYKPYVVAFHLNGNENSATAENEVEVVVRDYGRPIGVSYLPTVQDTTHELDHALFVGWTEAKPDDPAARPYHFFEKSGEVSSYDQAVAFGFWTLGQTEDTLVTHSMELWPVFADYTVDVNSNIDQELLKDMENYPNNDALWEKVRSLDRTSANTVSTTVRAKEVAGYKFAGWYTGVKENPTTHEYDDFSEAVAISEAEEYTLEGSEPFTSKLYTARYYKVYKVIYHNRGKYLSDPTKDPVIYTNYLYEGQDEDKALNKKIEEYVEKPKLDENGEFVRDADGNIIYDKVLTTYHQPLDPVPYHMIYATMDSNESFGQWECHEPDTPIDNKSELVNIYDPWSFQPLLPNDSSDETIKKGLIARVGTNERTINLYPTVWRVTVLNSKNEDISDQVTIDIDMSKMTSDYQKVRVYVCFDPENPYTEDTLTVHVQRTRWVETEDPNKPNIALRGRNDVQVIPYLDTTKTKEMAKGQMTADLATAEGTDKGGYAVFRFTNSLLRVEKDAPAEAMGETFLFQVTNTTDPTKTWRVPVKCDTEVKNDDGQVTGCTGSEVLSLPVGTYSVVEIEGWAWRQTPKLYAVYVNGQLQETEANDAHMKVSLPPLSEGKTPEPKTLGTRAAGTEAAKVVCTNSRITGHDWLVKTIIKQNLFGELLTSGGT